ncbi:hypothetical protein HY640_04255 [Candidatus Woesearchaeota archaeon]|nr:hypothetical protein [Candidatus Woesearchaeota archaeon]
MINRSTAIRHYKREDVQEEIVAAAHGREFAVRFGDSFGQRPDVLRRPAEVLELAQAGATSFHCSEELWSNPLRLSTGMSRAELDELRAGWDLVLDVDCAFLEYSKIAADEIVRVLSAHSIGCVSAKFSGNKGFHIGVPFSAFPEEIGGKDARLVFPESARVIAAYIKERIKGNVTMRLLELENSNVSSIKERTGRDIPAGLSVTFSDTPETAQQKMSGYIESFLNIDTVLISSRHLYRLPYSLHEKSGLVSVPIDPGQVMGFERQSALPEKIVVGGFRFLDKSGCRPGEAKELFDQAYYMHMQAVESRRQPDGSKRVFSQPEGAVLESYWPPCIRKVSFGLEDGRKRGLFILVNFLSSVGWEFRDLSLYVKEWNRKNRPPLGDAYVDGQIYYFQQRAKSVLPPNCSNPGYYADMGIKCTEDICSRFRNPAAFAKTKKFKYGSKK